MVEIGTILSFIQAAGIIVGVAYYIMNIRISQRNQELMLKAQEQTLETRRIGIFQNLSSQITSEEGLKRYYELMNYEWADYDEFERNADYIANYLNR